MGVIYQSYKMTPLRDGIRRGKAWVGDNRISDAQLENCGHTIRGRREWHVSLMVEMAKYGNV